jgi:2-polyprenyl-6-methoxyphenol hydroxylase-like FAD-dependent oxidoreductase
MSYKNIYVLGGGPIGLMCAIEAKQYFRNVTIIEKRQGYTRTNVPALQQDITKHLTGLGLDKTLWQGRSPGDSVAFSRIEEALWDRARSEGVEMKRGFFIQGILGRKQLPNGRFKYMTLILKAWDDQAKKADPYGRTMALDCDLLIVAAGGGAAGDPVILETLGFTYDKLKAKNYGAFGIFEEGKERPTLDSGKQTAISKQTKQMTSGNISFRTPDHKYLLVTLSGCTKADFKALQSNAEKLRKVLISAAQVSPNALDEIKAVQKNTAVFKIAIQRVRHFYSPNYPAVIVGDAAVTPHPEAGSGIGTGFKGFQELQRLLVALKKTHRSKNNDAMFMAFEDAYELHVSRKALEGTSIVIRNQLKLLKTFKDDVQQAIVAASGGPATSQKILQDLIRDLQVKIADALEKELQDEEAQTKDFIKLLEGKDPDLLDWDSTVGKLWREVDSTYTSIKRLTTDISLYTDRLAEIEKVIKFSDTVMQARAK